jgi:hypothetical protein
MDAELSARMFHVLVVMGAALGGCGPTPPSDGATDGATASSTTGDDPGATTQAPGPVTTSTTDPATTTSTTSTTSTSTTLDSTGAGSTGVIDDPADCEFPQQLKCAEYFPPTDCECDKDAPLVPADCEFTPQFKCDLWYLDPPWGCACDLNAPLSPDECPVPQAFNCRYYDPDLIGCSCECEYGPPHPESEEDCVNTGFYYCAFEPIGCCCMIQLG